MKSKPYFHKWYNSKEQAEFPNLRPRKELAQPAKRIRVCSQRNVFHQNLKSGNPKSRYPFTTLFLSSSSDFKKSKK